VAAPLAPDHREAVLWHETAAGTLPPLAPRPLPARADVVVVGAGYAGLSAARELAARGRSVVVLERDALGVGASTRNGGMAIPELKAGPLTLERRYGELGRRMHAEVDEAFDELERLISGDGDPDRGIDCAYERSGQLFLAHRADRVPMLEALAREHDAVGEAVRFLSRAELGDEIGSDHYFAGVVFERTGGLDPARLHAGLARLAVEAGAEIHDRTGAESVTPGTRTPSGPGVRVGTRRGVIEAGELVVTTNATADGLVPWLRRRVLPVASFVIATEVLDPDLAARVSPRRRMFVDSRNFLHYWRLTPDGRMLFGGRRSLSPTTLARARDVLYDDLVRVHPQLAGVPVSRVWGGEVAITFDRLPHAGRLPGGVGWFATGCNGSGVALNTWMGARVGRVIAGDAEPPACALRPTPTIPAWPLRRAYLPVVGTWLRLQDRSG
jgi:glycine/D-amino acid oxidase-like deaminating enzyme